MVVVVITIELSRNEKYVLFGVQLSRVGAGE